MNNASRYSVEELKEKADGLAKRIRAGESPGGTLILEDMVRDMMELGHEGTAAARKVLKRAEPGQGIEILCLIAAIWYERLQDSDEVARLYKKISRTARSTSECIAFADFVYPYFGTDRAKRFIKRAVSNAESMEDWASIGRLSAELGGC